MRFSIENEIIRLEIAELGAEMKSLQSKESKREYLWQANPDFWPRTAPILFPIVGRLVEDQYLHDGHVYPLSQHGFARDRIFEIVDQHPERIRLLLKSDYESQKFYPFDFELYITYNLAKNWVWIDYEVVNSGNSQMFFSVGAHPGFALPDFPTSSYSLEFEKSENLSANPLDQGLLKVESTEGFSLMGNSILLDSEIFLNDAIVFQNLNSSYISINDDFGKSFLKLHFSGFPWLGIWSKPEAPFVCIEPWFGHADFVGRPKEISEKDGVLSLDPAENFHCRFAIEIC